MNSDKGGFPDKDKHFFNSFISYSPIRISGNAAIFHYECFPHPCCPTQFDMVRDLRRLEIRFRRATLRRILIELTSLVACLLTASPRVDEVDESPNRIAFSESLPIAHCKKAKGVRSHTEATAYVSNSMTARALQQNPKKHLDEFLFSFLQAICWKFVLAQRLILS